MDFCSLRGKAPTAPLVVRDSWAHKSFDSGQAFGACQSVAACQDINCSAGVSISWGVVSTKRSQRISGKLGVAQLIPGTAMPQQQDDWFDSGIRWPELSCQELQQLLGQMGVHAATNLQLHTLRDLLGKAIAKAQVLPSTSAHASTIDPAVLRR